MKEPQTLQQAIVYFSDSDRAFDYAVRLRWPNGVRCPHCGSDKHSFIKTRRIWSCKDCKKQFTVKVKSIFEDSAIPLDKWMTAVWMLANCKNGISSHELARSLGITQKSAWFMLQRIREAMHEHHHGKKLGGGSGSPNHAVESDETFIGGRIRNMHEDRRLRYEQMGGYHGKSIVHGLFDRELRKVRVAVVPDVKRESLQAQILNNVRYGSTVYTDQAPAYDQLKRTFVHDVVNHAETYVKGAVHTNGLENFWSLLKRGLTGTYVAVEPFHLFRYVDEQVFRFNNRKDGEHKVTDRERFALAMGQVGRRRLTYSELTGKDESPRHETTGTRETQAPL